MTEGLTVVETVGVVGAGTMGVGITFVFAAAGCRVSVIDADPSQIDHAQSAITAQIQRACHKGRLDSDSAAELGARIAWSDSIQELPERLDLVVEAVPERIDLKTSVLVDIEARGPAVLASNTSAIGIAQLGASLDRPERFLGLHFFNPVWSMPLVEIVNGAQTSAATLRIAQGAVAQIGKQQIIVADSPGFATSRLGVAIGLEAMRMLEERVASAEDIDKAMQLGYRHPMGPLRLTDLVGLDVRLDIATNLAKTYGPRFDPPAILINKVAAGELGRKTGHGFYTW